MSHVRSDGICGTSLGLVVGTPAISPEMGLGRALLVVESDT
jgi:hypothetical protein